jgi:hypothetical protein
VKAAQLRLRLAEEVALAEEDLVVLCGVRSYAERALSEH